jgi:hypothetical protein
MSYAVRENARRQSEQQIPHHGDALSEQEKGLRHESVFSLAQKERGTVQETPFPSKRKDFSADN